MMDYNSLVKLELEMEFKIGDLVAPKKYPNVRGVIVGIHVLREVYGATQDATEYLVREYADGERTVNFWEMEEELQKLFL